MARGKNRQPVRRKPNPQPPAQATLTTVERSGPLPAPEELFQYNQITPGAADRIIAKAESEAAHRHAFESRALQAQIDDTKRGQFFGLIVTVLAILAGSYTAIMGQPWPGGFIGAGGVIGLAAVFVYGRKTSG